MRPGECLAGNALREYRGALGAGPMRFAVPVLVCCACLIAPTSAPASAHRGALASASWSIRAGALPAQTTTPLARGATGGELLEATPLVAMAPVVETLPGFSFSRTEVLLIGDINPEGEHTKFRFKASLGSSQWCVTAGATGTPIAISPTFELKPEDETAHAIAVLLTAEQAYICYELEAENASGARTGKQRFYQMGSPTAATGKVTSVGPISATIDGEVAAAEQATHYEINAALMSSTWCESGGELGHSELTTGEIPLGFEDATFHVVEAALRGLKTNTEYCAKLKALNGSGSSVGTQVTFKTPKAPYALTTSASATSASTAVVHGEVDPEGESAEYEAEYALASSEWCHSEGLHGSAQASTPVPLGASDETLHAVEAEVSGVTPGTEYCAALVALGSGPSHADGTQKTFTTPQLPRLEVTITGTGTGSVSGAGISCPGTCGASYANGTHVTLTAAAAAGSTFSGWSGACSGTGPCEVVMNANAHVGAGFAANPTPPAPPTPPTNPIANTSLTPPNPTASSASSSPPTCDISPGAGSRVRLARTKKPKPGKSGFDSVPVSVSCDQSASVTLDAVVIETRKGKHGSHSQRETLAPASGSVGSGETGSLTVRIPAAVVRALYDGMSERLSLTLHLSGPGGTSSSSATLSLSKGR